MLKRTIWLHIFKWRPYPDWGIWTDEFVGTNEEFEKMIKNHGIKVISHKRRHFIQRLPEIDKEEINEIAKNLVENYSS